MQQEPGHKVALLRSGRAQLQGKSVPAQTPCKGTSRHTRASQLPLRAPAPPCQSLLLSSNAPQVDRTPQHGLRSRSQHRSQTMQQPSTRRPGPSPQPGKARGRTGTRTLGVGSSSPHKAASKSRKAAAARKDAVSPQVWLCLQRVASGAMLHSGDNCMLVPCLPSPSGRMRTVPQPLGRRLGLQPFCLLMGLVTACAL